MTKRGWLIDKSALVQLEESKRRRDWSNRIERELVGFGDFEWQVVFDEDVAGGLVVGEGFLASTERVECDAGVLVRIASVAALEVGFSARSGTGLRRIRSQPPLSLLPLEYLTPRMEDRATDVQQLLADRGQHRAPSIPDLLIAAIAECTGLTVLHRDTDFELIGEVTGPPQQRMDDERYETAS